MGDSLDKAEKALDNSTSITKDGFKELKKGIKEMKDADNKKLSEMAKVLAKNIKKYYDNK